MLSATKASSPKPSPLGPSKAPALPSLITSLTSRRHVSEATATTAASDTSATSSLAPMDISVQHGRAESVRSVSTVNSEVSDAGTSSDTSTYTVRDDDVPLKETAKSLPQASTAQPAVAAKGSAFSTISGFLNRGLRINHPDMQEKTESIPKTSTGPHVKLTFRHEHKKMSCIVYYAQQFAGKSNRTFPVIQTFCTDSCLSSATGLWLARSSVCHGSLSVHEHQLTMRTAMPNPWRGRMHCNSWVVRRMQDFGCRATNAWS